MDNAETPSVPTLSVGQNVMWKGIPLVVSEIDSKGHIYATSLLLRVVTDDPAEFDLI